jgi:hypothetical protein
MADFEQHLNQAIHNSSLLRHLVGRNLCSEFADWYVTVAFYASVHFVEALVYRLKPEIPCSSMRVKVQHSAAAREIFNSILAAGIGKSGARQFEKGVTDSIKSDHHARRKLLLVNQSMFGAFYIPYSNLYEASQRARYYCFNPASYNYGDAEDWLNKIQVAFVAKTRLRQLPTAPSGGDWAKPKDR